MLQNFYVLGGLCMIVSTSVVLIVSSHELSPGQLTSAGLKMLLPMLM